MVAGDGVPHFGDLASGKEVPTGLTRVTALGRCLALSPDGATLALGTYEGPITLLDTQNWKRKGELKGHQGTVTCLCFSGDGKTLASGGEDKTARLWDVAGGYERATFKAHTDAINAVGLSADGRVLASGGKDKLVYVWRAPGR
jgi:WD40 repeat protein